MKCLRWLREAISDETGQADIAYIAIAALTGAAICSLGFISIMAAVAYFRCVPLVKADVVVNCSFDPLPMGQAAGLIFGAFGALIGALSGYMLATRKPRTQPPAVPAVSTVTTTETTTRPDPPASGTDKAVTAKKKGKR